MIALNKPYRRMGDSPTDSFYHQPVLLAEVMACLRPAPGKLFFDGTFGGGGHATALLEFGDTVSAGDQDPDALANAARLQHRFGSRLTCWEINFADVAARFEATATPKLDGVLLDLGVSSHQLESSARGFSYRADGPLDMRMGADEGPTAAEFLRRVDEDTLTTLLVANGERRYGRAIARAILASAPTSTAELAAAVERAVPPAARRRGHVASRTFQALRVAVNEELEELAAGLRDAQALLVPGGRLVVIAYHSGEDSLVKATMREAATGGCTCPPRLPCVCGAVPTMRLVTRGAHKASAEEVARNPRATSARLRAAERLAVPS